MLRRIDVMISVGLADSLNPSTVGPALNLANVRKCPVPSVRREGGCAERIEWIAMASRWLPAARVAAPRGPGRDRRRCLG